MAFVNRGGDGGTVLLAEGESGIVKVAGTERRVFETCDVEGGVGRQPFRIGRERAVEAMG